MGSSCVFVFLLGCGGRPSHVAPLVVVVDGGGGAAPSPASVADDAGATSPRDPIPSAHADASGCRLQGKVRKHLRLTYDAKDPTATFAQLAEVDDATVVLGSRAQAPSSVVVDALALTIDAQLPEDGVRLHARAPLGLAGVYDPDVSTPLEWRLTNEGLVVRAAPETDVRVLLPLEGTAECSAIGLEGASYPRRSIPKAIYDAVTSRAVGLAATPGGTPVAELKPGAVISVVEQKNGFSRVEMERRGTWLGWVPSSALTKRAAGAGYGFGETGGSAFAKPSGGGHVCNEPLPLFVRKTGTETALARIGSVKPNQRVALAPTTASGTFRRVLAEQRAHPSERPVLTIEEGFELVVRRDAAVHCTPLPK